MSIASLKTTGFASMRFALLALPEKISKKISKKALREAAKPIIRAARKNVADDTGLLRKSIGLKIKHYKRSGVTVAIIGARTSFKGKTGAGITGDTAGRNPAKYAHLVEFGTKPHRMKYMRFIDAPDILLSNVMHPGTKPQPFLEPAFDSKRRDALDMLAKGIWKGIKTEVLGLKKKRRAA